MKNLLADPLIRVHQVDGPPAVMSLPEVYEALAADRVAAFPALRPHQRHAWHAFLAQLGVIAMQRAGETAPPRTAAEWCAVLRNLTPEFGGDEPWRLIVDDPAQPAFMQCPAPDGLGQYRGRLAAPDDLDILVTAKNHDVKQGVALECAPDDWIFALIDLQTMGGFLGAGNYGIARMNGGFSARPCLGLAPDAGGSEDGGGRRPPGRPGAHLFHDMRRMLAARASLLDSYEDYFDPDDGLALLWVEPWDGTRSLDLRELDPYFLEICRRVRLRSEPRGIAAWTAASKNARVAAKEAQGNLGDFWTPVSVKDAKALSLSIAGFRYDRLAKLLFDRRSFDLPPALKVGATQSGRWRVVARGVVGGQGKTDGYHERNDVVFDHRTTSALVRPEESDVLAGIMKAQLDEVSEVAKALKFGIAVAASGGKPAGELKKADRMHAGPYVRRLDETIDARFFGSLERRFLAANDAERAARRAEFAREQIDAARALLAEAVEAVPCPAVRRHRARARAFTAFNGVLRGNRSVFSDQPEIFEAQEADSAA